MTTQNVIVSTHALERLADLLEQASRAARDLSRKNQPHASLVLPELKRPNSIPQDQAWFWSEAWQAGEREVNEALARGEYLEYETLEEALADLQRSL